MVTPLSNANLYARLNIQRDAKPEEIKKAYHRRSLHDHPDKSTGSNEAMKLLVEAYQILSDPEKRQEYDRKLDKILLILNLLLFTGE